MRGILSSRAKHCLVLSSLQWLQVDDTLFFKSLHYGGDVAHLTHGLRVYFLQIAVILFAYLMVHLVTCFAVLQDYIAIIYLLDHTLGRGHSGYIHIHRSGETGRVSLIGEQIPALDVDLGVAMLARLRCSGPFDP